MEQRIIGLDNLLEEINEDILKKSSNGKYFGIATITRSDLEKLKVTNKKANIKMSGILTFSEDITPELARETIESVKIRGTIKAPNGIKEVLNIL